MDVYCKAEYRNVQRKIKEKYDIVLVDNFYECTQGCIMAKIAFTNNPGMYEAKFTVFPLIPDSFEDDGLVEFFWAFAICTNQNPL